MIKFTEGDIFDFPADVRINTVNCVGVMGAGVALAFKNKYPEMFKEYQQACKAGRIKPGFLHIWRTAGGEQIINFPTKRHWRERSRYEDIEAGLNALREFLANQGRVRVVLPALGCGHGGLDWTKVSQAICDHLSDLDAEIMVFPPTSSREAGRKFKSADEVDPDVLKKLGIMRVGPGAPGYPSRLQGITASDLYVKGEQHILNSPMLALLPSIKPTEKEEIAADAFVKELARPGITFLLGYGAGIERNSIRAVLAKGGRVAIWFAEGIMNFRIRKDLQDVWDDSRIAIVSSAGPNDRWHSSSAMRARNLQLATASVALITDPAPQWLTRSLTHNGKRILPSLFFINYQAGKDMQEILGGLRASQVGRSAETGEPNVKPILDALAIKDSDFEYADSKPFESLHTFPSENLALNVEVKAPSVQDRVLPTSADSLNISPEQCLCDATFGCEKDACFTTLSLQALREVRVELDDAEETDEPLQHSGMRGFPLDLQAANEIAASLGAHLRDFSTLIEVKGDRVRLLSIAARVKHLLGMHERRDSRSRQKGSKQLAFSGLPGRKQKASQTIKTRLDILGITPGRTRLDRLHQSILLFGMGQLDELRALLLNPEISSDPQIWRLAETLLELYPSGTDERIWLAGALAYKDQMSSTHTEEHPESLGISE